MYIHIGGDVSLPTYKILGIFDIEKTSVNKDVNDYLMKLQKQGKIYYVSYDMPKSFIVTEDYVYISNVSDFTLKRRFLDNEIRSEI